MAEFDAEVERRTFLEEEVVRLRKSVKRIRRERDAARAASGGGGGMEASQSIMSDLGGIGAESFTSGSVVARSAGGRSLDTQRRIQTLEDDNERLRAALAGVECTRAVLRGSPFNPCVVVVVVYFKTTYGVDV